MSEQKKFTLRLAILAIVAVLISTCLCFGLIACNQNGQSDSATPSKHTTHSFGKWKVVTPATCAANGVKKRVCSGCSYEETDTIAKLEHTFVNDVCSGCGFTVGLQFALDTSSDTYTVTGYNGYKTAITIPSTYNGKSVTGIGKDTFKNLSNLTSITIPDSVTSIGKDAFYGTAWYSDQPNGIIYAGKVAYGYKNIHLSFLSLREDAKGIAAGAFSDCLSLIDITVPSSVISIGLGAFDGCNNITNMELPFIGATKGGSRDTHLGYIFGATNYSDSANYIPSSLKTVALTEQASIGDYAFYDCSTLTGIDIDGATSIGNSAFYNCDGLVSITIPNSVTGIGADAFSNCDGLVSIIIPSGVTTVSSGMCFQCRNLKSVTIPCEVTSIGEAAFGYCYGLSDNLSDIIFNGSKTQWQAIAKDSSWAIETDKFTPLTIHCDDGDLDKNGNEI